MRAPFSWFGGKSVASPDVWRLLGGVDAYGYQQGARSLTECLWASPSCMGGGLFGGAR